MTAHYRGNAPAINDLIGGQVQFAFDQISVGLPLHQERKCARACRHRRHRASWIPDVPTFAELGYKEFDGQTFTGLFAPSGTPRRDRDKLHDTMAAILKDPAIVEKFNKLGAEAVTMTPAAFKSLSRAEDAKWIPDRPQGEHQGRLRGLRCGSIPSDSMPSRHYRLMTGIVVPRPIAWVTSLSGGGVLNLAPFSAFTFVSPKPPMLAISVGRKAGIYKDTAHNILDNEEYVVHIADIEPDDGGA